MNSITFLGEGNKTTDFLPCGYQDLGICVQNSGLSHSQFSTMGFEMLCLFFFYIDIYFFDLIVLRSRRSFYVEHFNLYYYTLFTHPTAYGNSVCSVI